MKATFYNIYQVHKCTANDDIREALNFVHFMDGYAYASNGHVLVRVALTEMIKNCTSEMIGMINNHSIKGNVFARVIRHKEVEITEILLVVDAMTGQEAVNVAKTFNERLEITGVILTKLDGDTRGGACLSIKAVTGKPIKFIGVGEKLGDLEPFYPDRMASRILGMGDVLSLIEKAQEAITEEDAKKMQQKMLANSFTLTDYLEQFSMMKKMGGASAIMSMFPGAAKLKVSESDIDEKKIERTKAIILSMTKMERDNPSIIDSKRKRRIAAGSGTTVQEINQLLKQFEQTKLLMKQLKGNKGRLKLPF